MADILISPCVCVCVCVCYQVDDRFFWNKWMLQDLLDITCQVRDLVLYMKVLDHVMPRGEKQMWGALDSCVYQRVGRLSI